MAAAAGDLATEALSLGFTVGVLAFSAMTALRSSSPDAATCKASLAELLTTMDASSGNA